MPWETTSVSDQRIEFVNFTIDNPEVPFAAACRRFEISRPTGYKWLDRYDRNDPACLEDRSSACQRQPHATDPAVVDAIVALRRKQPTSGPKKLLWRLKQDHPDTPWPCVSTVGSILKSYDLVKCRTRRRNPRIPRTLVPTAASNDQWTIDFKGQFQTADQDWCYPLTLLDHQSRYLLACQAFPRIATEDVKAVMTSTFRQFGLPLSIKSDNGPPFGSPAVGRLSRLGVWWIRLGIRPCPIQPAHPEQNGAHERFHRTLREDTASPPAGTRRLQQHRFRLFRDAYNTERPHEALGMNTPNSVYEPSPRPFPERLPELTYPDDALTRRVHSNGCLRWKGHELFLSETLQSETIGLFPVEDDYLVVAFGSIPLAVLSKQTCSWLKASQAEPIIAGFLTRGAKP